MQPVDDSPAIPSFDWLRAEYLKNRKPDLDDLKEALSASDFPAIRVIGHNLKGTGAAYGFPELTELGREIEASAKAHDGIAIDLGIRALEAYLNSHCESAP